MSQTHTHALGESIFARAISELRAQASRVNAALLALETLNAYEPVRSDDGHLESSPASRAEYRRLASKPAKLRQAGVKSKTSPPPARIVPKVASVARTTKGAAEGMARVYTAVAEGYRTLAGIVKATKLPKGTAYTHVTRLVQAKRLSMAKVGRVAEYSLVGAAKPKPDAGLEPVWNGSKERAGVAPKLADMGRTS